MTSPELPCSSINHSSKQRLAGGASALPGLTDLPSSSKAVYLERAKRGPSKAVTNAELIPRGEGKPDPKETKSYVFLTQAVTV